MTQSLILNDLVTALGSVIVTAFVLGVRWGGIQATLKDINNRLSRIEQMFELVPKNVIFRSDPKDRD